MVRAERGPQPSSPDPVDHAAALASEAAYEPAGLREEVEDVVRISLRRTLATEMIACDICGQPDEVLVARTFRVVVAGRPVAWITETFPKAGLSSPAAGGSVGPGPGRDAP